MAATGLTEHLRSFAVTAAGLRMLFLQPTDIHAALATIRLMPCYVVARIDDQPAAKAVRGDLVTLLLPEKARRADKPYKVVPA